ncbi:MAG: ABC transporter permease [Deltaproteobacteria bacterium]|nr:ABC transporter permease [Deltaproteobacteria bacterium]
MSGPEQGGAGGPATAATGATESLVDRIKSALLLTLRDPNPILVKELRSTFRTNLFIRFLYLSVGVIGVIVLGGGAMVAAGPMPPAAVGQVVFQIFFSNALLIVSLAAPAYASTMITAEREAQTYESLILSGMGAWRIVRGKFAAAYASMFLVLVALGPIVGIAFIFGGISPVEVSIGFLGVLLVLATAIALGVAVSARATSSRIAILISTVVFAPAALFSVSLMTGLGELARDVWPTTMQGPFWWTDTLANHFADPRVLGLLVALPLYVFLMPVWLFLASAVSGIRPEAEDRSTPFKWWALVAAFGAVVIVALVPLLAVTAKTVTFVSLIMGLSGGWLLIFIALVFMNEPPLPPRLYVLRSRASRFGLIGRAVGPGAAPTLRFAALVIFGTAAAMAAPAVIVRRIIWPAWVGHGGGDVALLIAAVGNAAVAFCFLAFGVWLRVLLRNGVAARVLAVAAAMFVVIIPPMAAVIVDPNAFEALDREVPFLVQVSPIAHVVYSVDLVGGSMGGTEALGAILPVLIYGSFGAIFWVLVEMRCAKVRRLDDARREERDRRARTSEPPAPLLQRRSRPSLATAIAQRNDAPDADDADGVPDADDADAAGGSEEPGPAS